MQKLYTATKQHIPYNCDIERWRLAIFYFTCGHGHWVVATQQEWHYSFPLTKAFVLWVAGQCKYTTSACGAPDKEVLSLRSTWEWSMDMVSLAGATHTTRVYVKRTMLLCCAIGLLLHSDFGQHMSSATQQKCVTKFQTYIHFMDTC